jgi:hypothetical protein
MGKSVWGGQTQSQTGPLSIGKVGRIRLLIREVCESGMQNSLSELTCSRPSRRQRPTASCKGIEPWGIINFMRAYSEDLRKKVVEAVKRGMKKSEAAHTFGVSLSSVVLPRQMHGS